MGLKLTVDEAAVGKRLDVFLGEILNGEYSRSKLQEFVEEGIVTVNSAVKKPSYKLRLNETIDIFEENIPETIEHDALKPENIPLKILFEDDDLMVINKPKGMLTHPTAQSTNATLVNALLYHTKNLSDIGGEYRPGIVHRLDRNTSGLILVAKNNKAHLDLQKQIKEKTAKRKYLAVVYGVIASDCGTIDRPLMHDMKKTVKMQIAPNDLVGKPAVTRFKVLERFSDTTYVEVELETGRTHQIRAHMASIGHTVFNDALYGASGFKNGPLKTIKTKEQVLMSYYLSFKHPKTNELMEFKIEEQDYDEDLVKVLNFVKRRDE